MSKQSRLLQTNIMDCIKDKKVNWSTKERDVLVDKLRDSAVATGKFSSSVTATDKARFWADVAESVNSVSSCKRSVEQVKKKWIDLKSQTKKKGISHMQEVRKTGGGPAPVLELDHWESKVLQTIPQCSVEGIENGTDTFLVNNDATPDLPVGSLTECLNNNETQATRCGGAANSESGPVQKKPRCDKRTETEALVREQTAVMREFNNSIKILTKSVNCLKESVDKLNDKDYLFHL